MKLKKWLALLCAAMLLMALATGCGGASDKDDADADKGGKKTTTTVADDDNGDTDSNNDSGNNDTQQKDEPVKQLNRGKGNVNLSEGGLYYQENGKYGITSFDGEYDSGAVYVDVEVMNEYFVVQTKAFGAEDDFDALNSTGLMDGTGKFIIPAEYAVLSELSGSNGRYIKAIRATAITTDTKEYLVKLTTSLLASGAVKDGDILYSGTWCIYDLATGKKVENVGGPKNMYISAYEDYFYFQNEDLEDVYVMANGKQLTKTSSMTILNNSMYKEYTGRETVVYDVDGNKLFSESDIDYYTIGSGITGTKLVHAYKSVNDGYEYILVNAKGETVFGPVTVKESGSVYAYGELLLVGGQMFRMDGTKVLNETFNTFSIRYEPTANIWCGKTTDDKYVFFDEKGTVLYKGAESDTIDVDYYDFYVKKIEDGTSVYYSFKDKDFILNGGTVAPWLHDNGDGKLIHSLTGEVVLEGYSYYRQGYVVDGMYYVIAKDNQNDLWYLYSIEMDM